MDVSRYPVYISCTSQDDNLAQHIADHLKSSDFTIVGRQNNDAVFKRDDIFTCKIFIVIITPESAQDKRLNEDLCLAYVANKSVFPVGRQRFRHLKQSLTSKQKLMLAKINWEFFLEDDIVEEKADKLKNDIISCITHLEGPGSDLTKMRPDSPDNHDDSDEGFHVLLNTRSMSSKIMAPVQIVETDFWARNFEYREIVPWSEFAKKFEKEYSAKIKEDFGEESCFHFLHYLYKDVFGTHEEATRKAYDDFIGPDPPDEPDYFMDRLGEYVLGNNLLRFVLNTDSTVRIITIQNLASFNTRGVMRLLLNLTEDEDPNIRAIAGLTLAKSGRKSKKIEKKLLSLLQDEDRLVRESACLSLAYMRCESAVSAIIDVWRNDAFKEVREAAMVSLRRIGSKEAEREIYMTELVDRHMKTLKPH